MGIREGGKGGKGEVWGSSKWESDKEPSSCFFSLSFRFKTLFTIHRFSLRPPSALSFQLLLNSNPETPDPCPTLFYLPMLSHKRVVALAALAALVFASLASSPASADWCADQRARCLKRCGKESDMDFDCRDKNNARSVSCSCANGASGFTSGDSGSGSSFSGSGAGAFVGSGLGGGGLGGGLSPDQVARDGFNNVARVARGESPLFFGGAGSEGDSGGARGGGSGTTQPGSSKSSPVATSGKGVEGSTSSSPSTSYSASSTPAPAWAIALAVIASLVAATCAGALGFVVARKNHERKKAASVVATPSLPLYDAAKPSAFAPSSPVKGHAML